MRPVGLAMAALLLVAAVLVYLFIDRWRVSPTVSANKATAVEIQAATPRPVRVNTPENSRPAKEGDAGVVVMPDAGELVKSLNAPDATAREDIEIVQSVIESYRRASGGASPFGGLNEEVMDTLRGKNPKHLAAFPPNHPGLDSQGRLLDRWGTPYFFHPVSEKVIEIRSAGPDGKLWTEDDVHLGESSK